jgi:alpha/beta superfamily hydrolase
MHTGAGAIRSLFLDGPSGQLEAILNLGTEKATHSALVCHPHPVYGGTLHNKVVFHAMKALNGFGFPALRFNFRGAGLSHGEHDHGQGEIEDVRTALDWLEREFRLPIVLAGFSFVSGSRDPFGPRTKLQAFVESLPEPKKLVIIESADHFFEGRLREMREAMEGWVRETGLA